MHKEVLSAVETSLQPEPHPQHALGHVFLQFVSAWHTQKHTHKTVTRIYKHGDTHVGAHAWMNSSSMQKRTHQLFSWAACKHTCREGKRAKPAVKIPLDSLFLTQTLPPSLVLPPHTHTHHILPPLFFGATFLFSQTGLPSVRPKSLSFLHLS